MKQLFALLVALVPLMAGVAVGQNNLLSNYGGGSGNRILSAYGGSGGGGDYRNALRNYGGGGSSYPDVGNGYTGAYAAKRSHTQGGGGNAHSGFSGRFTGSFNAQWLGLGWNNALGSGGSRWQQASSTPPCGNFQRAGARCRATTTAWDPTFSSQRGW